MILNRNRTDRGYYKAKYPNLGKTELKRIPSQYTEVIDELLTIANEWGNETKNPIETLVKLSEGYKQISQSKI